MQHVCSHQIAWFHQGPQFGDPPDLKGVSTAAIQGQTDHLGTQALPEDLGSVGGPMRCPWYLFHRLF
ncbi:unnamed protein product [Staurois parvus]|uniref:Uncharacterized protein n=1 Tax=Staurois parvus TaxID=386267 RepID=A0ABN9G0C9_9NEOB|nr:unnamed protein product [Staurois parvus]